MRSRIRGGTVSVFVLSTMTVLLIAVLGTAAITAQSLKRSLKDSDAYRALHAAQAGLEKKSTEVFAGLSETSGEIPSSTTYLPQEIRDLFGNASGVVQVQPTTDPTRAWITSTVSYNGVTRRLRSYVHAKNVGVWNNAIFAGSGASGQAINGNVDIRGSMHLLGDGEPYVDVNGNAQWDSAETFTDSNHNGIWDPGEPFVDRNSDGVCNPAEPYNDTNHNGIYDPPLTQTDMNSVMGGNAYVGNNYSGMPLDLETMVPTAPRISGIEQLGTEVRVKHGRISINGSATIGAGGSIDGGTSKGTVDGVYVNDGFTGNQGASAVFSDNGTTNSYDLASLGINFPIVAGIGAEPYVDSTKLQWPTQESFLEARSLTVPVTSITETTAAFSYGPDAYGNKISFTPKSGGTPATLNVTGIVRFANDLQVGASKQEIRYKGNGTLYCRKTISVSASFLPEAGLTFPTTARVGMLALQDLKLACGNGDAQLKMAGAFYAQGTVISRKQNQIAGTFVGNFYDMGTNVPNIYQVPSLPYNMPPGMPGDKRYFTLKAKSWRNVAAN